MGIECSGKQGAAFYHHNYAAILSDVEIYEPSIDYQNRPNWGLGETEEQGKKIIIFESTPINVTQRTFLKNPSGFAVWRVYSRPVGGSGFSYRGAHGKLNSESFCFTTYLNSTQSRRTRFHKCGSTGTLGTLTGYHAFGYQQYSHGDYPVTLNEVSVMSAEGFLAYKTTSEAQVDWSVHCGCEHGNCQQGTFPLKYCCFSCMDAKRWLTQIRDDSEFHKHQIQGKLGKPLTYNPR